MFTIRLEDFSRLYKGESEEANVSEKKWAEDFRNRNPECPAILRASSFKEALQINNIQFDYQ